VLITDAGLEPGARRILADTVRELVVADPDGAVPVRDD
jgi:hypothetical protein